MRLAFFGDRFSLKAESGAEEEVDTLRTVAVEDLILAMQPVIELEEEREIRSRLRTKEHSVGRFATGTRGRSDPHIVLETKIEVNGRRERVLGICIRCAAI